jgi:hypothetical protein
MYYSLSLRLTIREPIEKVKGRGEERRVELRAPQ